MRKTIFRFFTIADYAEEEAWLREQSKTGLALVKAVPPGFYTFESCSPQDVVYRMDYKNRQPEEDYLRMAEDYGWEYVGEMLGWLYFRRPAGSVSGEGEEELFSDNASRAEMAEHLVKTRLVPVAVIFLCCVVPNLLNAMNGSTGRFSHFFTVFFGLMFGVYAYLIVHCGLKLKAIRDRNQE
jgi:hypothetical protein